MSKHEMRVILKSSKHSEELGNSLFVNGVNYKKISETNFIILSDNLLKLEAMKKYLNGIRIGFGSHKVCVAEIIEVESEN